MRPRSSRVACIAALFLAALSLAGCWLTKADSNEVLVYPLDVRTPTVRGAKVAWQLAIEEPVARGPMSQERIVIREEDGSFSLLANTRWSERAPELVQNALLRVFEDAGRVPGVVRSTSAARSDYTLMLELRAFEVHPGDVWSAHVVLSAKLVRSEDMNVVAARVFRAHAEAESGAAGVVGAFSRATSRVAYVLHHWVIEVGELDWPNVSPPVLAPAQAKAEGL